MTYNNTNTKNNSDDIIEYDNYLHVQYDSSSSLILLSFLLLLFSRLSLILSFYMLG